MGGFHTYIGSGHFLGFKICMLYGGFSYIHRLGSFFGVQNFESHYFLGFSEK